MQVIGTRGRGQISLSISIILIPTKEAARKRKMRAAKLCPSAIMEEKYLKAGIHLLVSARGREKRGQLKDLWERREGAGNLLVIRMIKVRIGAGQGWIWARWVVLGCMLATPALLLQHELHPRSTWAPVPRE